MAGQEQCGSPELTVKVNMLGPFGISLGGRVAGPWPRPSARRLCQLVLLSPRQRVSQEFAAAELFGSLGPQRAATALRKALSMARGVLAQIGEPAVGLLQADRDNIWFRSEAMEIDLDRQERALRAALAMGPGQVRDDRLVAALSDERTVLADAPYVEWALRCRDRFEVLRQQARLTLARDRSKGAGLSSTAAVLEAWESCLGHDPACEEAAAALMRLFTAQGARPEAARTYERCRAALAELGLSTSPALDEVRALAAFKLGPGGSGQPLAAHVTALSRQARKTISVLFAEITGLSARTDPEDLRDAVARTLSGVITEVEALGGTVNSISGGGLQAIFGAPQAHEDDPERAVRAAFRAMSAPDGDRREDSPVLRIGIETGVAVVGPFAAGTSFEYGAVGAVVGAAAALQSAAKPGGILVGPATRAATQGIVEWGATEEVIALRGTEPLSGSYLVAPRAKARGRQLRLGGRGPLVGRQRELALVSTALRDLEAGRGSVVVVVGEPGLGKTRLLEECRKHFMAWVGARRGRLPLWQGKGTTDLWLEIMLAGRAQLYLHLREPELARAVLSAARPVLEANGSASQRHIFYRYLAWQRVLECQWRIDEQVIETARLAVASAKEAGEDADIYREKGPATAWATLFLGWFLLLRGGLDEAEEQLVNSLSLADRSGDLILRALCLSNLAGVALRRHDKNAVRSLAPRAEAAGEVVHLTTVVGAAKACLAWLAWQDGRSQDVVVLANEAEELFRTPRGLNTRACKWLYIWPLVAVRLQEGRVTQAVTAARELLDPSQQRLPDELQSIIESACLSWDKGEADAARTSLTLALEMAYELRFF